MTREYPVEEVVATIKGRKMVPVNEKDVKFTWFIKGVKLDGPPKVK